MHSTRPTTLLLVEDHGPTRRFLADNLTADGYEILECDSLSDGHRLVEQERPDLVVVDVGLPDGDGLELVRSVRQSDRGSPVDPELPLIVLSGRSTELQRLRGFQRGCDDYVAKPFSYPEVHARIGALLRRGRRRAGGAHLRVGPLEIDNLARRVEVAGKAVHLSKKEFALLRALAAEPTRAFTREELLRGVWGFQALGATRTLDSHASRLRRKLRAHGLNAVVSVWGVGYRLVDGEIA
jgi:DNA-binding response OmpR family regulator